ncbi:MAG: Gfo/Idh/MocA family oxidoreductase [Spirochaetes bacterium]|nr:Gfo/Idh/MocA family oxidoreductase [Spirochaetota bacterium]
MAKYKVGVFGVGGVSIEYIKAVNNNPLSEVAAVVGRDKKKTEVRIKDLNISCDVLETYDDLLNNKELDAIIITSPHFMHSRETIKAARAGKHVICEKPIGMTWDEVTMVHDEVKKAGIKFECGFALRWNLYIENIKRMLDTDIFGKLFYIEVDYFHRLGPHWNGFTWGGQKKSGGPSAALVAGIHAVDLIRYLYGEVDEVFAGKTRGHRTDFEYWPTYISILKFKNGAIGKTSCSFEIESPYLMNFILHGSKGSVVNDKFYFKELFPGQTGWQNFETIMPDSGSVSHHPFKSLINDFIKCIDEDKETVVNIGETLKTHELCMAIDKSIETNDKVQLPLRV